MSQTVQRPGAAGVRASDDELRRLGGELAMYAGRFVRAVTRDAGNEVPGPTLRLLSQVEELGPVGISPLAVADRCSQPTMSAAVRSLCDKGWAAKEPDPDDARACRVRLTDDGRAVLRTARDRNADLVAARLHQDGRHDPGDVAAAVQLLRHILDTDPTSAKDPHA